MKYELIKKLPFENSPEIGYISIGHNRPDNLHYYNHFWFNPENYPEFWQPIVELEYEILSFTNSEDLIYEKGSKNRFNAKYQMYRHTEEECLSEKGFKIHSVKRLSDNQIFTVGDNTKYGCIDQFYIKNNHLMVTTVLEYIGKHLKDIIKIKKPLFTTEDSVDIFEGDIFWNINYQFQLSDLQVTNNKYELIFLNKENRCKQFSTKEKAEEYILMNKPCLSLNDIEFAILKTNNAEEKRNKLKELVKSKLK